MEVCNCSMFCRTLLYVHSSIAIILMGKRELIVLLNLSSWCLVMVERLFLAVPRGCLQFVIVVFPDHTHLLFSNVLLFNAVISLDYGLPNDLHKMWFVDCKFLKRNKTSHIMKCVSFSADKALLCISQIHYVTLK